jgi:hypothetical protein
MVTKGLQGTYVQMSEEGLITHLLQTDIFICEVKKIQKEKSWTDHYKNTKLFQVYQITKGIIWKREIPKQCPPPSALKTL